MRIITIEMLKNMAALLGIKVMYENLHPNLQGKASTETKTVTLNASLRDNPIQEKCVLAHEIGHILFPPRPGHVRYHSRVFYDLEFDERSSTKETVAQDETKAQDWAICVLMPDVEFNRIMENKEEKMSIPEIAEFFEVETSFANDRIAYYRRKEESAGRKVPKWRDLIRREK